MIDKLNSVPVLGFLVPDDPTISSGTIDGKAAVLVDKSTMRLNQNFRFLTFTVVGPGLIYVTWKSNTPWYVKLGFTATGLGVIIQNFVMWKEIQGKGL